MHSYEEVKKLVEDGGSRLLSDEYKNNTDPLSILCSCGRKFNKTLKVMKRSNLFICNKCIKEMQIKNQTIPYLEAKVRVESKGYTLITKENEYEKAKDKSVLKCPKGHIYEQILSDFFKGHGCKKCSAHNNAAKYIKPYSDIKNYIEKYNYTLLTKQEDYKNTKQYITVMCNNGHIYPVVFSNFLQGARCPQCYSLRRGTSSIIPYEDRCKFVETFEYKILTQKDEYINGTQEILFECNKGHVYKGSIHGFVNGYRCTICKNSKGENMIALLLGRYNISYINQYKFLNCKFKRALPFDFFLPKYNTAIEFDGKQHYEIVDRFGGIYGFIDTKIRDFIKDKYCRDNSIKLIRRPYWDFDNIEKILLKELKL